MAAGLQIVPCGYGPRGTPAYCVLDAAGNYVAKGAWIVFTRAEAEKLVQEREVP